jgi:hypothetical protein
MSRRVVLALLLISSLLSIAPTFTQGRSLYYGISANTRSAGSAGAADAAVETGVTRIREDLEWWLVEPSNDEWDWSKPDLMYEEAAKRGLSILPIPESPPCWAVVGQTNCSQRPILLASEYAEFVGEAAARYGPGGDFWDAHPNLDGSLSSRYIEILNEPYWERAGGILTPYGYANIYKAAVIAGRAANPSTRYLIASATGGSNGVEWLAGVYSAEPAIGTYIDGIAVHPYPGSHGINYAPATITDESFLNAKINYEQWVARGVNKPVWITEVGYSSCNDPEHCVAGSTQSARENQKAAMLEPLLDVLGTDEYGFVHAVYLYNLRQTTPASEPNDKKSNWYGISYGGGFEPLPAWSTFVDAVEAYDGVPEPDTTITANSIAGESATFSFSRSDPTSTLACQLDEGPWTACNSPKTYASTGGGPHVFKVRATNTEAVEASPATYSWVTPPGATTEGATEVKGTGAVLNGSVNPRGTATSYYLEYGATTAYGSTVPISPKAVGSGSSAVKVSESVSGLTGNTTYHFRVVAENASGGITKGSAITFKTAKTMESSLASLPLIEPFDGTTGFGSGPFMPTPWYWYKFPWAAQKGQDTITGWGPHSTAPAVDGAYFAEGEKQSYQDSPSGAAVAGTIAAGPTASGQYISLWLVNFSGIFNLPKGYELRIAQKGSGQYDVTLFKLSTTSTFPATGIRTTLGSVSNYSLSLGAKVALADTGGSVSAWIDQGAGFNQILSASDAAYSGGWVGLSGVGTAGRLVNFKGGPL